MLARRLITLAIALLSSVTLMCGGFDENEMDCEDAVAHLQECCPSDPPTHQRCRIESHGCGGTTFPTLTTDEVRCILRQSCDAVVEGRMCERAEGVSGFGTNAYSTSGEVCR